MSAFEGIKSIFLCGYVGGAEFDEVFHSSELLLHTESFNEKSMDFVKHSVSTKIADSMGSGIPIVAYGPENVSSMKHLIRNDCVIIIRNEKELEEKLLCAFEDAELRKKAVQKALKTAAVCHVSKVNSSCLYGIIEKAIDKNNYNIKK